jgi:spermidine synthase
MARSKNFILLVAFLSGIAVTAMEISATRIVAPFVGSSSIVWTNVIGVVLAALSVGYYVGGRLAEKRPDINILLAVILGTGIFFLAVPYVANPIIRALMALTAGKSAFVQIFFGSALITVVLFGLPLVVLGMVSPFLIKVYSSAPDSKVGIAAGSISALSTVGSIIGTFLPTLWLIPQFGTKRTILVFAFLLVLLGAAGMASKNPKMISFALIGFTAFTPYVGAVRPDQGMIYETESAYQYIQVRNYKGVRYLMFNQERGFQSKYDPKAVITGYYYDYFPLLPHLQGYRKGTKVRVLLIGLAGAAISREFDHYLGDDVVVDAIEVDPKAIEVSRQWFALDTQRHVNVINEDGRIFLDRTKNKYDLILVDAYQNATYIPWTLTTQEFWRQVQARLKPRGIVSINVNVWYITPLIRALANTQASIFRNVYMAKARVNYLLTASDEPLDFTQLPRVIEYAEQHPAAEVLAKDSQRVPFRADGLVLTDDRAPVEFLTYDSYRVQGK